MFAKRGQKHSAQQHDRYSASTPLTPNASRVHGIDIEFARGLGVYYRILISSLTAPPDYTGGPPTSHVPLRLAGFRLSPGRAQKSLSDRTAIWMPGADWCCVREPVSKPRPPGD
jgi:hypothetical protein